MNTLPTVRGHVFNLTVNLIVAAVFYIFFGAAVSYGLSNTFPAYGEEWKNANFFYQISDVAMEISIIIVASFWLTYFVNSSIPILPVPPLLEHYIESFGGQAVFLYAVFLFMETLDDKLIHVFQEIFHRGK